MCIQTTREQATICDGCRIPFRSRGEFWQTNYERFILNSTCSLRFVLLLVLTCTTACIHRALLASGLLWFQKWDSSSYSFVRGLYTVCIQGTLRLKTAAMAADYRPIDDTCDCLVCQKYSRAHLHAKITKVTLKSETILGSIVDTFLLLHHSQLKTRHHIL